MSGHTAAMDRRASIAATRAELMDAFGAIDPRPFLATLLRRDRATLRAAANVEARRPVWPDKRGQGRRA